MGFLTGSAKKRGFESPGLAGPGTDEVRTDSNIYGGGTQLVHMDEKTPYGVGVGPRSDTAELNRYRGLGEAAAKREAYNVDFSAAQGDRARGYEARDGQLGALAMQRDAAMGNAPSRAAIMGNQAAGQSLEAALGASAGARTYASRAGGGMAAAQMMARGGMGGMQLGAQQQAMAGRSGEMNAARGQYAAGATGMRAGDYEAMAMSQQQAEAQAKAEMEQRRLNQAGQMGYEQMGLNVEQAVLDASMRRAAAANQANATARDASDARTARAQKLGMGLVTAVGSMAAGSDSRMKQGATMLSDAHAKREAYLLGRAHEGEQRREGKPVEYAYGGRPKPGEDIIDKDPSKATEGPKREMQTFTREARPEPQPTALQRAAVQYMDPHGLIPPPPGLSGPAAVQGISAAAMAAAKATGAAPVDARTSLATTSDERAKRGATMLDDIRAQGEGRLASGPAVGGKSRMSDAEAARLTAQAGDMIEGDRAQLASGPSVRRVSDGTKENGYNTELTSGAEEAYRHYANRQFPNGMNDDYDLRGAFASGTQRDDASMHYPDTYKKPNHETFSNESQYAKDSPETSGRWDGDRYEAKGPPAWLRREVESERQRRDPDVISGGSVGDKMTNALADGLKPYEYEYKPGFAEAEGQQDGEKNVGPMAQDMASNPITGQAVQKRDDGLLQIDMKKATKLSLAAAGHNAQKIRELEARMKGGA